MDGDIGPAGAMATESSALSSHPRRCPHKLSIWPPWGTVLAGGTPHDLQLLKRFALRPQKP